MSVTKKIRTMTTAFAAIVSLVAALAFPVAYFFISYRYLLGSMDAHAETTAQVIANLVSENPRLWRFETIRIEELVARHARGGHEEVIRIFAEDGEPVLTGTVTAPWPRIHVATPLLYAGTSAGCIEISHSLRPLLRRCALMGVVGILLGWLLFKVLPYREVIEAGEKLQEANDFLVKVMEGSTNAILVLDGAGRIQMVNERCAQLTRLAKDDLLGLPFAALFQGQALPDLAQSFQGQASPAAVTFETELASADGNLVAVLCGAKPLLRGGHPAGMVVSLEDLTERRLAEDNRHRIDKLESVGLLAGGIAHDFNNLLAGILGNVSMARMVAPGDAKLQKYLANAEKASTRAADLTRQLLTFSKGGAPVKKRVAPGGLIRESATFAMRGAEVACVFDLAEPLWSCEVDEGQISQVIGNLIINAVQAMPSGGTITVAATNVILGGNNQSLLPPGPYLAIAIRDQGVGIPKDLLPKIFNPYFTTKQGGNGLGLATAFSILKKHEGTLQVASEAGRGSTFTLFLPALDTQPPEALEPGDRVVPGSGRILVMDDEEVVRDTAMAMLEQLGYEGATASDGAQAIAHYRQAAASGRPFAAVIMDLTIPGAMGGREALASLLDADPAILAVVSSGYSESPIMARYRDYGFHGVLKKPYTLEDLSLCLATVLVAPISHLER